MLIVCKSPALELDVGQAFGPEDELWPPGMIYAGSLPDAAVRGQIVAVAGHERSEVLGARLLLSFDEELESHRKLVGDLQIRVESGDPGHEVSFVVGRAAREETAVSGFGREGLGVPELNGIDGLDVV